MKPQYNEKNPIKRKKYLISAAGPLGGTAHMYREKIVSNDPCIISPNMTPKKNGNETHANKAGFASLYVGVPYVSTIL